LSNYFDLLFHHTVAQFTLVLPPSKFKHLHEIPTGSPPAGALNTGAVQKIRDFLQISHYNSQTIQDIAIVTMEDEYELVCDLSNGAISNDLERSLTLFSR